MLTSWLGFEVWGSITKLASWIGFEVWGLLDAFEIYRIRIEPGVGPILSRHATPCKVTPVILHGVVSWSSYTGLCPQTLGARIRTWLSGSTLMRCFLFARQRNSRTPKGFRTNQGFRFALHWMPN